MLLKAQNINKTYTSNGVPFQALHDISLSLAKGEFSALCGPSGSGKTTLLNIMGCIDNADNGNLWLDGETLSAKNKDELALLRREYFGFIFQTYNLLPVLSVYENIEFPLKILKKHSKEESNQLVMQAIQAVGLEGLENRKPSQLSGGQQQRVSIARALVKRPRLVLADEPTANLDTATGEEIVDLMRKMNEQEGITFLFSTHDQTIMAHAKRIIRLRDGRIIDDGSERSS